MALLQLVTFPNKLLCTKAPVVAEEELPNIIPLLNDMVETLYAYHAFGLAAQQVGKLHRVIVVDCGVQAGQSTLFKMINPVITVSEGKSTLKEGCLSMPKVLLEVPRAARIGVHFRDEQWQDRFIQAQGLLAHVIQHEVDHLDGLLMSTRVSRLQRDVVLKGFSPQVRVRGY